MRQKQITLKINLTNLTEKSITIFFKNSCTDRKMPQLDLPPYIINVPFLTAIRKDCIEYIDGVVRNTPCMATSLFYTVDEDKALCMFDEVLHYPVILLMTPFAYAILFESKRALKYFAKKTGGSTEAHCYVADCLDPDGIWYRHYRVIEFSPVLVRRPTASLYAILMDVGFKFDEPKSLKCSLYKKWKLQSANESVADNAWEAMWSVWGQFRNPAILLDSTSELLIAGCNARKLARRVDFGKLLTLCHTTKSLYTQIVYFLQLLIFHGIDMQDSEILANYLNAVLQLTSVEEGEPRARRNLFLSIYYLAGNRIDEYGEFVENIQRIMRIKEMPRHLQQSLQMQCVRLIRQVSRPRGFYRNIWKSRRLNEPCKRLLLTGLPDFTKAEEPDADALVQSTWNAKKTHFSLRAEAIEKLTSVVQTEEDHSSATGGSSRSANTSQLPSNGLTTPNTRTEKPYERPYMNYDNAAEERFQPEQTPTSTATVGMPFNDTPVDDERGVPTLRTIPNRAATLTDTEAITTEPKKSPADMSTDPPAEAVIISEDEGGAEAVPH